MLRVGLTGGIACGKSHVLRRLALRGCHTLDLDRVAHDVMAPGGSAYADVVAAFGPAILRPDGAVDRKALAAVVFADPVARGRLNGIVHPRVRLEEMRWVGTLAGDAEAIVVVDAALLVEAGLHLRFDRLVVVHCSPEQQLQRLMARDALSHDEAAARIGAQMPIAEKRRFAHLEVDTSGAPDDTQAGADALAETLFALARRPPEPRVPARAEIAELMRSYARSALELQAAARLLDDIADSKGIELSRIAALAGRSPGQWLALPGDQVLVAPMALMPPVAAFCLARRGLEDESLGIAALSVGRALTAEPRLLGCSCVAMWRASRELAHRHEESGAQRALAFAGRWSGEDPDRLAAEVDRPAETATASLAIDLFTPIDRFLAAVRAGIEGEALS